MTDAEIASALAALGHEARLKLFRLLMRAGPEGLSVGEIGRHLGLAPSTLAHHLGALVAAGLVEQEKQGRAVISRADFAALRGIFRAVEAECCAGVETLDDDAA
ncbi:ArsR/SmtB family transcription factor [Rhodovulum sp. DZ06]|uniref:ArsR/SmtB family transcription factor n=1 Tax=Rhodovulum sp. DZ06 TaxID=3425126 RepID=UPI003D3347C5